MRKPELAIAALGVIVAILALIPAFGQWLFPRESPPIVPVAPIVSPTPLSPTPTPQPIGTPATATSLPIGTPPTATTQPVGTPPTATTQPVGTPPTATVGPTAHVSSIAGIASGCDAEQFLSIELPLSPIVMVYESDAGLRPYVQLAKELVVVAMEIAIAAAAEQDARCVREIYAGALVADLESLIFSGSTTGMIYQPRIEWQESQLEDIRVRDVATFEADVCLYQGIDVLNLQGQQIMTYPPELAAATYVFQRFDANSHYYVTGILELDPFVVCQ